MRPTREAKKASKTVLKTWLKTKEVTYTLVFGKYLVASLVVSIRATAMFLEDSLRIISGTWRDENKNLLIICWVVLFLVMFYVFVNVGLPLNSDDLENCSYVSWNVLWDSGNLNKNTTFCKVHKQTDRFTDLRNFSWTFRKNHLEQNCLVKNQCSNQYFLDI
jgi:hypothetical protein